MATDTQATRLRADIGATDASLPKTEVDDIFEEASESYTATAAIKAHTRVIAIRRLLASSAKLTTYRQNQSSENLSDIFKHLEKLLAHWENQLSAANATGQSVAKFGRTRSIPRRIAEFPDERNPARRNW
jgi:hypothetical protein